MNLLTALVWISPGLIAAWLLVRWVLDPDRPLHEDSAVDETRNPIDGLDPGSDRSGLTKDR